MKIAIIGTGAMAQNLCQNFKAFGEEVVAVCGHNAQHTQDFAQRHNVPQVFIDVDSMLQAQKFDLICIVTPNDTHKTIFAKVIRTSSYILLEKPIGMSAVEAQEIAELAKGEEHRVVVDHELRFNPIMRKIKAMLEEGAVGKISAVNITTNLHHSDSKSNYSWMDNQSQGGGQMLLMGTHILDLALYLLHFPQVTKGLTLKNQLLQTKLDNGQVKQVTSEQQFSSLFKTDNEIEVSLFNNALSYAFRQFEIKIFGDKGLLVFDEVNGLRYSNDPALPMQSITVSDDLAQITLGRSLFSKSSKYLINELLEYIQGKQIKSPDFCTIDQALQTLIIFEKTLNV